MTSIDSTAIPEPYLAEELLEAYIEDGETYDSSLSLPKLVIIQPETASSTAIIASSISSRQITFTVKNDLGNAYGSAVKCAVMIRGRR